MQKAIIGAGLALLLGLSGCTAAPAPTVTVTATENASGGNSSGGSSQPNLDNMSDDETFDYYMDFLGVDDLPVYYPSLDPTLRDLAKSTCEMLDSGFTQDEINAIAVSSLGADDGTGMYELVSMTMVAGTHAYCPEWTWVWGS
jgi:hypothetical protein